MTNSNSLSGTVEGCVTTQSSTISGRENVIPEQLRNPDFKFVLLKTQDKVPFEKGWQENGYSYTEEKLLRHIENKGNFGIIGGYGNLRILDADEEDFAEEIKNKLPGTFTVKTGSGGKHFYLKTEYENNHVFIDGKGEFRAKNYQVVCPGCIHPNGNRYVIENDVPILELSKEEIQKILDPYIRDQLSSVPVNETTKKRSDSSRSAKEYKEVIKLVAKGKTKEDVFREMSVFKKWSESHEQYRELTYQKALSYVEGQKENKPVQVTKEHMEILKDKNLYNLIDREFEKKIEGEYSARMSIFFTFNMRNVKNLSKATDNLMVNDPGGTGKDHVVSAVFEILPDNEKMKRARITPKVLSYLNDMRTCPEGWTKKCLYLEDVTSGTLNDDCFKVMCSADTNGVSEVSVVVNNTLKNIMIKGKPSLVITIASSFPKQELLRRFPICNLTGTEKQTVSVLKKQAKFAVSGFSVSYDDKIKKSLSVLKRVSVKVPFADKIAEVFPAVNVISRTHFPRFLDYIKSSASLYQYQRESDSEGFIIATEQDYENARQVLTTTTSNQLMIPLTRIQRQIIDIVHSLERKTYSVMEMEPFLSKIGVSDRWVRKQLDKLTEYGFFERDNEKRDNSFKPVAVYRYLDCHKIELPKFQDLVQNSSNTTPSSLTSYNTNSSFTHKKTGYLNYLKYMNRELDQQKMKKLDIYQSILELSPDNGGVKSDQVQTFMNCSTKDFSEFLGFAINTGLVGYNDQGLLVITEKGFEEVGSIQK